jgi:hypothetical protein
MGSSQAATPDNTFVMAKDIADIITMDPAEVFELTTGEIIANIYDRIMMFEPEDLQTLVGGVAESWEVSNKGSTITFKIRPGLKFHSGNPVRAEDVAWSLQRVVKLNKTPAFIITQFGWTVENVDELVKAMGMTGISKSQVSRLCAEIDERVGAFLDRPIEGDWPYLWIDATYVKVREGGRIISVAVIIAVAVNTDGRREILGLAVGPSPCGAVGSPHPTGSRALLDRFPAFPHAARAARREAQR